MPPINRSYFATYGGQRVTPYAGEAQPGQGESFQRQALGMQLARTQPSPYGAPTPMAQTGADSWLDRMAAKARGESQQGNKQQLQAAAASAGNFAGQGEAGYGNMTGELDKQRQFFNDMMMGRNSVASEQLRQGLQQQQAAQMSMAAGASPQNAAMGARTAAMMMGRNQSNMAGQAALAQLQERQMAAQQLAEMNLGQRGQDINVGLGSRQNQMTGLGANKPDQPKGPSRLQQIAGGAAIAAGLFSDERLKTDVKSGDKAARRALEELSAHTYRYKDPKYGAGTQLGVMAQALERAGLKQAVIDTPEGKAIDVGKLTGANTSMLASVNKRLSKLEGKK